MKFIIKILLFLLIWNFQLKLTPSFFCTTRKKIETGQIFVKWVSSSIAKSFELGEIDLKTVEQLIAEVCTHLIAAGVMKQIIDGDEMSKDVFCVSEPFVIQAFCCMS